MRSRLDTICRHGLAEISLARFDAHFGRFVLDAAKANFRVNQELFGRGSCVFRITLEQTGTFCNGLAHIASSVRDGALDFFWIGTFAETDDRLKDKQFDHIIQAGGPTIQGFKRVAHFTVFSGRFSSSAKAGATSMVADSILT